jgi:AcrR family transcriptional regulator
VSTREWINHDGERKRGPGLDRGGFGRGVDGARVDGAGVDGAGVDGAGVDGAGVDGPGGAGTVRGVRRVNARTSRDAAATERPQQPQPQRGRPRSEKARTAILDAAAELLLAHGLSAVSMDAVAEKAGVSKATIYRWWPTKETLALDALYTEWAGAGPAPRNTGTLRGDLLSLLRPWARLAGERSQSRVIAALLSEAHSDPAFAEEYRRRILEPRREVARDVFLRAVDRGEIAPDTKIEVALDVVYGPIYHRLLQGHAKLSDRFVQDVVDMALRGILRDRGGQPA